MEYSSNGGFSPLQMFYCLSEDSFSSKLTVVLLVTKQYKNSLDTPINTP